MAKSTQTSKATQTVKEAKTAVKAPRKTPISKEKAAELKKLEKKRAQIKVLKEKSEHFRKLARELHAEIKLVKPGKQSKSLDTVEE